MTWDRFDGLGYLSNCLREGYNSNLYTVLFYIPCLALIPTLSDLVLLCREVAAERYPNR